MGIFSGYRTYLMGILIVLHQILKTQGIDIPQENISIALDVLLGIGTVIFRKLANKPIV